MITTRRSARLSWVSLMLSMVACGEDKTISLLHDEKPVVDGGAPAGSGGARARDARAPDTGPGLPKPECTTDGDCQAPRAHCNQRTSKCVECLANDDCSTLVCDAVAHTCTGCLTNGDCDSATPICDRDDRRCVECDSASQCPSGQVCAFAAHRCAPACQTSADCAGSGHPICAAASRVCVECTSNADCVAANLEPHCELALGVCVECTADADCATGHCYNFEHFCVQCTSDAHCGGRICDSFICR